MKKVVKFGGSSLASAQQFQKVGEIIRSDEARRYVIPSAPGKRFDGDTKVTDMLYDCYAAAENGEAFESKLEKIKKRYYEIIEGLGLTLSGGGVSGNPRCFFRESGKRLCGLQRRILKWYYYGKLSGLRVCRCRRGNIL